MDSIADLIPVAVVIGYLFLKFAGRPRRAEAPPATGTSTRPPKPTAAARPGAGPTPFEQLLARLEQANASPRPTPPPPVRPLPLAPPAVKPRTESPMVTDSRRAVADYEARTADAAAFRTVDAGHGFDTETAGYAHERHGFGLQNPLSEPAFEATPGTDRRVANVNRQGYDPHGLRSAPAPAPQPSIADRLKDAGALRDAFVLQTILTRRPAPRSSAPRRPR